MRKECTWGPLPRLSSGAKWLCLERVTEDACMRAGSKREPDLEACRPNPPAGGFQPVPSHPGLYSEFGASLGYSVRP